MAIFNFFIVLTNRQTVVTKKQSRDTPNQRYFGHSEELLDEIRSPLFPNRPESESQRTDSLTRHSDLDSCVFFSIDLTTTCEPKWIQILQVIFGKKPNFNNKLYNKSVIIYIYIYIICVYLYLTQKSDPAS
jgi:hypothetical protein